MYIIIEDLNGTDIYETMQGDCVSFFGDELKDGTAVVEVGIKRVNGEYEMIYRMTDVIEAKKVPERYLKALENNDKIFYLSQVYWGMSDGA